MENIINDIIKLLDLMPDISINSSNYIYGNKRVPRVTGIIQKCIHNDGLMYWANSLGFKHQSYKRILTTAANIGTECHNNIDHYLDDNTHNPIINTIEAKYAYESFLRWYNDINTYGDIEVLMHEESIVCKYFGGTLDGLYRINDKIYLVDYKTSNNVRYNYCLQLAAYIFMLKRERNISVDGCIILHLSKTEVSYTEYHLDFTNHLHKQYMDDCMETFLLMVLYYYHLINIENTYNTLDW